MERISAISLQALLLLPLSLILTSGEHQHAVVFF